MKRFKFQSGEIVAVGFPPKRGRRRWIEGVVKRIDKGGIIDVKIDVYPFRRPIRFCETGAPALSGIGDFVLRPMDDMLRQAIDGERATIEAGWTDGGRPATRPEFYPQRLAPT